MAEGNKRLSRVLDQLCRDIGPGITLSQLENKAQLYIRQQGGKPSFQMVPGYRWATCININQGVVHGIPNEYRIQAGDLVSIDVGLFYRGFHLDTAWTVLARAQDSRLKTLDYREKQKFLEAGKEALEKAIKAAKPGNWIGHISKAIEQTLKKYRLRPVRELTGHGVGRKLHEEPLIPGQLREKITATPLIKSGMALAIEVIYTQGRQGLILKNDGWTIETADGKPAGLFEKTVLIR